MTDAAEELTEVAEESPVPVSMTAEMVMAMSPKERLAFMLYMQRDFLADMIQSGLDAVPAIVAVPLLQWLKHAKVKVGDQVIKGVTPETMPDLLIASVMAADDEWARGYFEAQREVAEFLLWTPEKGELPAMITPEHFLSAPEVEPVAEASNGHSDSAPPE